MFPSTNRQLKSELETGFCQRVANSATIAEEHVQSGTVQMNLPFRLHHIGFVVPTLDAGQAIFRALGFEEIGPVYSDSVQKVTVQFIRPGTDAEIELIVPAG